MRSAVRPSQRSGSSPRFHSPFISVSIALASSAGSSPTNSLVPIRQVSGCSAYVFSVIHQSVANQLFSCYAKVGDARSLASVIGEDELSPIDKQYLVFGNEFEHEFIGQGMDENRSMEDTLNKAWELLGLLPREELDRIDSQILDVYYDKKDADTDSDKKQA